MYELSEEIALDKNVKHNIEIIVDRLVVKPGIEKRLTDSVENVLQLSEGLLLVDVIDGEPMNFSQSFSVLSVRSVLMRLNHAVFLLTIHLVLARNVLDLDTKWNFQKN